MKKAQIQSLFDAIDKNSIEELDKYLKEKKILFIKLKPAIDILAKHPKTGDTCLHYAIRKNKQDIVKFLISKGLNATEVNNDGVNPFQLSIRLGKYSLAKILIDTGVDINLCGTSGNTLLHEACESGIIKRVSFLLFYGADFNIYNSEKLTPLHLAAAKGHYKICEQLILKGADVNRASIEHPTPLHEAAENGHLDVCTLLLSKGANPNAKAYRRDTPLHYTISREWKDIIRLLIEYKADINAQGEYNYSALHIAAHQDKLEIINLLLDLGAKIDVKDNLGMTPLYAAIHEASVYEGSAEVVKLLMSRGANIYFRDFEGRTILQIAEAYNERELFEEFLISFLSEKQATKLGITDKLLTSLVEKLNSNDEVAFLQGLTESVQLAESGNIKGLWAIQKSIHFRSKKKRIKLFKPGIVITKDSNRYNTAKKKIISLASKRRLLQKPYDSGNLITAFMQFSESEDSRLLLRKVYEVGGPTEGYAFQLLFNELIYAARFDTGINT